jgi:hypothetical protein
LPAKPVHTAGSHALHGSEWSRTLRVCQQFQICHFSRNTFRCLHSKQSRCGAYPLSAGHLFARVAPLLCACAHNTPARLPIPGAISCQDIQQWSDYVNGVCPTAAAGKDVPSSCPELCSTVFSPWCVALATGCRVNLHSCPIDSPIGCAGGKDAILRPHKSTKEASSLVSTRSASARASTAALVAPAAKATVTARRDGTASTVWMWTNVPRTTGGVCYQALHILGCVCC